jgi:hypothetical protein
MASQIHFKTAFDCDFGDFPLAIQVALVNNILQLESLLYGTSIFMTGIVEMMATGLLVVTDNLISWLHCCRI